MTRLRIMFWYLALRLIRLAVRLLRRQTERIAAKLAVTSYT